MQPLSTFRARAARAGFVLLAVVVFGSHLQSANAADATVTVGLRQQGHQAFAAKTYSVALSLYERAAAAGDLQAAERAGEILLDGDAVYPGVPQDLERASTLLKRAACAGSGSAAALLDEVHRRLDLLGCHGG